MPYRPPTIRLAPRRIVRDLVGQFGVVPRGILDRIPVLGTRRLRARFTRVALRARMLGTSSSVEGLARELGAHEPRLLTLSPGHVMLSYWGRLSPEAQVLIQSSVATGVRLTFAPAPWTWGQAFRAAWRRLLGRGGSAVG